MRAKAIFSVKISETGFNELNICSKGPEKHKISEKKKWLHDHRFAVPAKVLTGVTRKCGEM